MKTYKLTYLLLPDLKGQELNETILKTQSLIQNEKGVLIETQANKEISLGYKIKKRGKALIGVLRFQLAPEKIKTLEIELKKIPQIMRFMLEIHKIIKEISRAPRKIIKKIPKEKKVELKEIEKKLEGILGES